MSRTLWAMINMSNQNIRKLVISELERLFEKLENLNPDQFNSRLAKQFL
jgi:hypothetical protein